MTQLTEQFHLPERVHEACDRLTTLVQTHARRLLREAYWADDHIRDIAAHAGPSYTYVRDDAYDAFADTDAYLYSRFERCVYHRVAHVLDAHHDAYRAFQFVTDTVAERTVRGIGWRRLRSRLFSEDTPYIEWRVLETVVEQLNAFYDTHGRFPDAYTELVAPPEPNGTLPYAPDKGDYHVHDLSVEGGEVVVMLNAPDSLTPGSHHDWTRHEVRLPTHSRFHEMTDVGDVKAPTLHTSDHGYTLDVPVDVPAQDTDAVDGRVLAVDLGVKKQATAVVLDNGDEEAHEQVTPPAFLDHAVKEKLFRLNADAEGVNDRLAALRRQGKAHTQRFEHLLGEYRRTRRKERRLREQLQHDVANELVWLAITHGCEAIVFESLGQMDSTGTSGAVAWSISSWARGDVLAYVDYKAGLVGIGVATVNPWGTSRHCPRCGERGQTVRAPDERVEERHGGHFRCPACGFEGDRDYVGALNVGRKHLSDARMEAANPAAYTDAGNHASLPSSTEARSAGVQSTTDEQDPASGRQTQLPRCRAAPLTVTRGEADAGGLHTNHGSDTGARPPRRSVTRHVLASATDSG